MSSIIAKIKAEPAVVGTVLAALFAIAVSLGANISSELQAGIISLVTVVIGLVIRSKVTPTNSPTIMPPGS